MLGFIRSSKPVRILSLKHVASLLPCFLVFAYFLTGGVTMAKEGAGPPILDMRVYPAEGIPCGVSRVKDHLEPPPGPGAGVLPPQPPPRAPGATSSVSPPPPRADEPAPGEGEAGVSKLLSNAALAVKTVREAAKYFSSWKVWVHKGPAGDVVFKAAILYRNVAVGCLEFDPTDGSVLPKGYHPFVFEAQLPLDSIKQVLPRIVAGLRVLNGAEFRDREKCWVVPLAYESKIVAHVKVFQDGIHVVPDYPVDQEMRAYGR